MTPIQVLIRETMVTLEGHRRAGRMIEAAACRIRIAALRDAEAVLVPSERPTQAEAIDFGLKAYDRSYGDLRRTFATFYDWFAAR